MDTALPWIEAALVVACLLTLCYAAYSDVRRLEVANNVSVILVVLFFPTAGVFGLDLVTIGIHIAVGTGVLIIGFMLFSMGLTGGADAKLLAAAALWVGIDGLSRLLILMALIGGLLAILILIARRLSRIPAANRVPWLTAAHWRDVPIPYCVAISIATALSLPSAGFIPTLLQGQTGW